MQVSGTDPTQVNAGAVLVAANDLAAAEKRTGEFVGDKCEDGRYGIMVGNFKVCPVCASGTTGDGFGCTTCAAGTRATAVGSDTCVDCTAGSYAQHGEFARRLLSWRPTPAPALSCLPPVCGSRVAFNFAPSLCAGAPAGSSHCLPCPAGTYSADNADDCTEW